jgi:hypothetical protein
VNGVAVVAVAALLASPAPTPSAPARLQVVAKEFSFVLSRQTIRAGDAILELANFGEDAHDLRLRRVGGHATLGIDSVAAGRRAELEAVLRPGRYVLWCSIGDHRARGMHAVLRVAR